MLGGAAFCSLLSGKLWTRLPPQPPNPTATPTCCSCATQPEEALTSAVEEFTAQGVDLSNIIKTVTGGDISTHPAAQAVERLQAAAAAGDTGNLSAAADAVAAALSEASDAAAAGEVAAVLHKADAAQALAQAVAACGDSPAQLLPVLRAVAAVLGGSRDLQADFLCSAGVPALQTVLTGCGDSPELSAAALQAAAAAAAKNEGGKAALMAAGVDGSALAVLRSHSDQPEALQAACAVLCTLTNPDDDTVPASRCVAANSELGSRLLASSSEVGHCSLCMRLAA